MGDQDPDSSGGSSGSGGASSSTPDAEDQTTSQREGGLTLERDQIDSSESVRKITFKRKFLQNIRNIRKGPIVDLEKVKTGWLRVPYDQMRFSLTPRNVDILQWEDYMMVTEVGFTIQNFRIQLDIEHITALGVDLEAKASSAPTVWSYIDSKNELPYIQEDNMNEDTIKTNVSMQKKRQDCELKELVYDNVKLSHRNDVDKLFWEQDFELTNRAFNEMTLGTAKVTYFKHVNMPWVKIHKDFVDNQHVDDDVGAWLLPKYNEKGIMDEETQPWITRSIPGTNQKHIISGLKYGADLPIALIKISPITTIDDAMVPITCWFWAEYFATVKVKHAPHQYGSIYSYPFKHTSNKRNYNMGTKVSGYSSDLKHKSHITS